MAGPGDHMQAHDEIIVVFACMIAIVLLLRKRQNRKYKRIRKYRQRKG